MATHAVGCSSTSLSYGDTARNIVDHGRNELAYMNRKRGGWTFQELNAPLEQLKQYTEYGPDMSHDFFTRAADDASLPRRDQFSMMRGNA
jgi:hypothetical protein